MSSDDNKDSTGLSLMYVESDEYAVLSEQSKMLIDQRTERLLHEAYRDATEIIKSRETQLRSLAAALIEHETLSLPEIKLAIEDKQDVIRQVRKKKEDESKLDEERRKLGM